MARTIVVGLSVAILLAGCEQTAWQKPGATEQELAGDFAACDLYAAGHGDAERVRIRIDPQHRAQAEHRAEAARNIVRHRPTPSKGASTQRGSSKGSKGEAIAEGAILALGNVVAVAENAKIHDDCMTALGWTPGKSAPPVALASNDPADLEPARGDTEQPATKQLVAPLVDPTIGLVEINLSETMADPHLRKSGRPHGLLIASVDANTPEEKIGLEKGDVVLSYDGQPVATKAGLRSAIAKDEMQGTITVLRDEQEVDLTLSSATYLLDN